MFRGRQAKPGEAVIFLKMSPTSPQEKNSGKVTKQELLIVAKRKDWQSIQFFSFNRNLLTYDIYLSSGIVLATMDAFVDGSSFS